MNPGKAWRRLAAAGLALAVLAAAPLQARMGGGHSYSGGGSNSAGSSSSHSSGGGGGHWSFPSSSSLSSPSGHSGIYFGGGSPSGSSQDEGAFRTFVEIVILILVVYILWRLLSQSSLPGSIKTYQSDDAVPRQRFGAAAQAQEEALRDLKARDKHFSKVLFLDFASLLYHKYYSYRGSGQFKQVAPFLSKSVADQVASNVFYPKQRVRDIVIGNARIQAIQTRAEGDTVVVEFESNMTVQYAGGEQTRFANREQWTFARQAGLLSPPPPQMRTLSCPACGAPADFTDAGECPYCHAAIQAGEKQWQVSKIGVLASEPFQLESPGGYVEEQGTELPTLKQEGLDGQGRLFAKSHGFQDFDGFFGGFCEAVAKPYFLATYAAWSQGEWRRARHLVSDRLYESNQFWMAEYARQGWRNRLENIQILAVAPARIDLDKFYESITVRIFASCLDYTEDKQGKLVGGSPKKPRKFSEYWTFIRAAGVEKPAEGYDLQTCPSCGAPADKVGQAGDCGYCGSKITDGQFSWVLAAISQDEAYEG